jgi:hypothetical protein
MAMQTAPAPAEEKDTTVTVGVATPREPDADAKGEAAIEAFARDHEALTDDDERDALDFLLAPKPARLYNVPTEYETERGTMRLLFVIRGMDGRRIDSIEQANVSDSTGKLDATTAACQLVAEGTAWLEGRPGHQVRMDSDEFLSLRVPDGEGGMKVTRLASPADALEARFKTQLGLVAGVARELRRIAGYDPSKVGSAQRRLADAVGNS